MKVVSGDFLINQIKIHAKSEDVAPVNYIGLHVLILVLEGIQHENKIGIFA